MVIQCNPLVATPPPLVDAPALGTEDIHVVLHHLTVRKAAAQRALLQLCGRLESVVQVGSQIAVTESGRDRSDIFSSIPRLTAAIYCYKSVD